MAYRDNTEALRAKISVLERQAQRATQLELRVAELEAENAVLRGPEEGSTVDVELTSIGPKPVSCIKAIRSLCGLGLKEAKELAEAAPKIIKRGVAKAEAVAIKTALEDLGAWVKLLVAVQDVEVPRPAASEPHPSIAASRSTSTSHRVE